MTDYSTKESVETLVPHKGKMFLLNRISNFSLEKLEIETEVDITDKDLFYDEELGGVPAWVAFEYMAQSISALSGIYGKTQNEKPKVGFIMSVTSFKAHRSVFSLGETVKIKVHQTMRMDMAVTFDGMASIGNETVVTAVLNTVEVPDPKKAVGL
ncbi:MAG: thioester dehydrase [Fibrobacteraceae bacterium]|nr:thioester dehydrase [Fibrobacteraceae bacterium]